MFRDDVVITSRFIPRLLSLVLAVSVALIPQYSMTADLPLVLWKAQIRDGHASNLQVLGNGNIVASRGTYAYEMYNPDGVSLLKYPAAKSAGQEARGILFLEDGSYVTLTSYTENYDPGKPFIRMQMFSPDHDEVWSLMLPDRGSRGASMHLTYEGILLIASVMDMVDNQQQPSTVTSCYSRAGHLLWTKEFSTERGQAYPTLLDNGNLVYSDGGNLRCLNPDGETIWEHQSWGIRREFQVMPDGSGFALIKAPERLVRVDPDGQLSWEFNITEHATGRLNSFFEDGHAFGGFVDVAASGTVYFCDPYGAITAVSSAGDYLWSVIEPEPPGGDPNWDSPLYYNSDITVAPGGTVYAISRKDNLMAISPEGEVLYVDRRFAEMDCRPSFGSDGTVYVASAGWLYALDPAEAASVKSLEEQEAVYEAERQREMEWEKEFAEERQQREEELSRIEAEGGDTEADIEEQLGGWKPENPPDPGGQPVADRTVVAGVIVAAIMGYYADHGEFPPYLLGVKHTEDPLIEGEYLRGYPLAYPQPGCWCCMNPANTDDTQHVRWSCAVSTPGCPVLSGQNSRSGRMDYGNQVVRKRDNCLSIAPGSHDNTGWSYFGYQRGEWLGRSEQEAWLWFYGSNIWPEQNNPLPGMFSEAKAEEYYDLFHDFAEFGRLGFDLLNDETGELVPDGKRDGICLLYRLADGELQEVIRADGI